MKRSILFLLVLVPMIVFSQDNDIRNFLPGEHNFTYERISATQPGLLKITFSDEPNIYLIRGMQQTMDGDYLKIEGTVQIINDLHFIIDGVMEMKIGTLNNANICKREGIFNFTADLERKNWELTEKISPCYSGDDVIKISVATPKP